MTHNSNRIRYWAGVACVLVACFYLGRMLAAAILQFTPDLFTTEFFK